MVQEIQTGALYQPRMMGWGYMLKFDRKQQISVKQISFNLKRNGKK